MIAIWSAGFHPVVNSLIFVRLNFRALAEREHGKTDDYGNGYKT
jgi:hypothetical protein